MFSLSSIERVLEEAGCSGSRDISPGCCDAPDPPSRASSHMVPAFVPCPDVCCHADKSSGAFKCRLLQAALARCQFLWLAAPHASYSGARAVWLGGRETHAGLAAKPLDISESEIHVKIQIRRSSSTYTGRSSRTTIMKWLLQHKVSFDLAW
jgi:hypothetical protein